MAGKQDVTMMTQLVLKPTTQRNWISLLRCLGVLLRDVRSAHWPDFPVILKGAYRQVTADPMQVHESTIVTWDTGSDRMFFFFAGGGATFW